MPGQNGTGPLGQGPQTGRGMGPCGGGASRGAGNNKPGLFGRGGRGLGRGSGRGFGFWKNPGSNR